MTVQQLHYILTRQPEITKRILFYPNKLRSTKEYYSARCEELLAKLNKIGTLKNFIVTIYNNLSHVLLL